MVWQERVLLMEHQKLLPDLKMVILQYIILLLHNKNIFIVKHTALKKSIYKLQFLGTVMVWDVRQKEEPVATFIAAEDSTSRDCWCVAFGNSYNTEERVVVAGYDNGDIMLYDLRTMSVRWSKCVKNGAS